MARGAGAVDDDLRSTDSWIADRVAWLVALVALGAVIVTVGFSSFSATGADASGYLSHTTMLLEGMLRRPEPLAWIAKWPGGEATLAPLGWLAAAPGLQAPTYAIGLPVLMAPLHTIGCASAAGLVVPVSLGVAVCIVAALAGRIAGPGAALIAAVWLATSPVALVQSMQVMSDVPATAAWMLGWWLAFKGRPLAAGLAAAVAILIRPNLAPVAALPALYTMVTRCETRVTPGFSRDVQRLARFATPVALAGITVAYLQWRWFGSPLRSGYGTAEEIYALSNIVPNAALYSKWLFETHGVWLFLAPLALVWPRASATGDTGGRADLSRPSAARQREPREVGWLIVFALLVVGAYLVYAVFEVWTYLRFMLPAMSVAMISVASVAAALLARVPAAVRVPTLALVILALLSTNIATARQHDVFRFAERHVRAKVVGERLGTMLPANAAIVSGEQSGAMRYYTGRSIVRWDVMDADAMRDALESLTQAGYQVWVVLDDWEEEPFRLRLSALAAASLDHEPTVESAAGVGIRTRAWRVRSLMARSSKSE
jgi:hypothetical protein